MMDTPISPTRLLAVDPTTRGIGYAVLDLPHSLIEWGMSRVRGEKNGGALVCFERLLARFRPDIVVIEDFAAPGALRRPRVQELLMALAGRVAKEDLAIHRIARSAVKQCFASTGGRVTKYSIATSLATRFPELASSVPRRRKVYESENPRMATFNALALAVTHALS